MKKTRTTAPVALPQIPEFGFLRLKQIIGDPGDPTATPPIPPTLPIFPVSRSAWFAGIKAGRYPAGVKLSQKTRAWPVSQLRALFAQLEGVASSDVAG